VSAARALFGRLIDHAPTFPPAQLPVAEALAEDRRARASAESWMLARLAWPASKLAELGDEDRELTVIVDAAVPEDRRVAAVESRGVPAGGAAVDEVYLEDVELDEVAALGARAKVRCGGERVPSIDELAELVRGCRERRLPFKATAGLHHAVRGDGAHGFLNLLAAAVFDEEALAEDDPESFRLEEQAFIWRNRLAGPVEIEQGRKLFVAFGSCSFFEPVDDLKAIGLM
jgi:hypothetical protein